MASVFYSKKAVRLGKGFGDSVDKEKQTFSSPSGGLSLHGIRSIIPPLLFITGFLALAVKLFMLTVVAGAHYRGLSESNRIREERISPQRGVLYDRHENVLAENRPIYKIKNEEFAANNSALEYLYISREEALERETAGEEVIHGLGREYLYGPLAPHIVGYMSEINADQMSAKNSAIVQAHGYDERQFCYQCYGLGDLVGASGVEMVFEDTLRGIPGKRLYEVDAQGTEIQEIARVSPQSGESIFLSLDISLQESVVSAVESMRKRSDVSSPGAAALVLSSKTGEVLALYSSPTYDPNLFVGTTIASLSAKKWREMSEVADETPEENRVEEAGTENIAPHRSIDKLLTDSSNPLFNRALGGLYPPGSTFKLITAAAGLEESVIDASTEVEDTGVLKVGSYSYGNWYYSQYGGKDGHVAVVRALARSNDIFFYKVGEWLRIERLKKWAHIFKTGAAIDTELDGEAAGVVARDRDWYLGDTYHAAIGQGDVQATPLHVAVWTQIVANDGAYCTPTFLRVDAPGKKKCEPIGLSPTTIEILQKGMVDACSAGGTAWPLYGFMANGQQLTANQQQAADGSRPVQIACKTGTAEFGHPDDKTHAWLTAYAPADNPEIVVTVLLEEGGEGSSHAGPVVRDILHAWFEK